MNFKPILKSLVPHLIAIAAIFAVSSAYFSPAFNGKSLRQDDVVKSIGGVRDKIEYRKYENKDVLWTNVRFSGMPDFLSATYKSSNKIKNFYNLPQKLGFPNEVGMLIWYMLGFYILLIAFRVNPWLALAGAIAFGLTSYNLIIIEAGHFKKVRTIAFIAPTLAGVLLTFRKKYLWGFVLTAFFLANQIAHDHVQMSYYLLLGLVCIGLVELYNHVKEKRYLDFGKAIGLLFLAALLAIGPNYSKLSNLYRYNKQSIRGKSELTVGKDHIKTKGGLDRDYINAWSSGRAETMMLFAPRVKGGASAYVKQDRNLLNKVDRPMRETVGNMNQYWGDQGGSGGPNTAGSVIFTLFIIGLFVIKGPIKQGILISVILFVFLSWGKYFSGFTDIFIDYVPLYNKFRTPVSILAVAVIFITFFAFLTVSKIIKNPGLLEQESKIKIGKKNLPLYLVGGLGFIAFLLLNIAFPHLLNRYINDQEMVLFDNYRQQAGDAQINAILASLESLRISVFRADFFRTLLFAAGTVLSFYLFKKHKIKKLALIGIIGVLALIDVWTIGQRYVNKDDFTRQNLMEQEYLLTDVDKQIFSREIQNTPGLEQKIEAAYQKFQPKTQAEKEDIQKYVIQKNTYYRVYDLTTSAFQDNRVSGSHRSIGGYSAAKLRRYQDLIENHIMKGNMQVLNMLNTKYIITQQGLQVNPGVMGPAWFVDSVVWANTPDEEIASLNDIDVTRQTVVNTKFKNTVGEFQSAVTSDSISLETYEPDYLKYQTNTKGNRLVIFSEIYYPDWTVTIDGKPTDYFESNYTLRAMMVPAGQHTIEFSFNPVYYSQANTLSMIFYYIIILMVLVLVGYSVYIEFTKANSEAEKA
ncbi:YfhO family protein [Maribellus sediminis]|uniref:YfhO family protein n=1 Tax=Maribellus sediminis TaxID=2696285 RepID=UPI00142FA689|nr:YfhO family protein [Maribellus sediminis]